MNKGKPRFVLTCGMSSVHIVFVWRTDGADAIMSHMSKDALQAVRDAERMALDIVRAHLPDRAYRVFLFGSRAGGTAHERSDIDIGIEGPRAVPHETLAAIVETIDEMPTLYSVDVVDFARVPETFRSVARERVPLESSA